MNTNDDNNGYTSVPYLSNSIDQIFLLLYSTGPKGLGPGPCVLQCHVTQLSYHGILLP